MTLTLGWLDAPEIPGPLQLYVKPPVLPVAFKVVWGDRQVKVEGAAIDTDGSVLSALTTTFSVLLQPLAGLVTTNV